MAVTLETVEMWSEQDQAVVTWDVTLEDETDEGGNIHPVITARCGEQIQRYSPSTTDEELLRQVKTTNEEHN